MPTVLEVDDVHAGYGSIEVLRGLHLTVPAGAVVALLGANGVGKTTAMRAVSGVVPVTAGSVRFLGEAIHHLPVEAIAARGLVSVPEGRGVFPGLSVEENLRLAHSGLGDGDWATFLDDVADRFPRLTDRRGQVAGSLSGGEQQMLAICRAMAGTPDLVLFDELSMGLAPVVVERLYEQVAEMCARNTTVVLVEQFLSHALALADVCYVMAKGRVVWAGEPSELRAGRAAAHLGVRS